MIYTTQVDVKHETFDVCVFWLRAVFSTSPNIGAVGPPLVACPRLLIQVHPYLNAVASTRNMATNAGRLVAQPANLLHFVSVN